MTGAGSLNTQDVAERLALIRRHVSIPVGVGFGIRDAESAQRVARSADAVVIGSKLIETMEQAVANAPAAQQTDAAVAAASGWLRTIRQALDQVTRKRLGLNAGRDLIRDETSMSWIENSCLLASIKPATAAPPRARRLVGQVPLMRVGAV